MANYLCSLPPECELRPARAAEIWAIRFLVLKAKLDPTQLRWQQFTVIECNGRLVACGQLRTFKGAQELGSVVVAPEWRGRGLGSCLVAHLVRQARQPLYIECLGQALARFYSRFGFKVISWQELPPSLKIKFGLSTLAAKLFRMQLILMYYSKPELSQNHLGTGE